MPAPGIPGPSRGAVLHPVRGDRGDVPADPGLQIVGDQFRREGLDASVGTVPVPLHLVPLRLHVRELPERQGLLSAHLHDEAVLDVEMSRSGGVGGRHEQEPNPAPHVGCARDDVRLHLVQHAVHELVVRGILLDVQQRQPGLVGVELADDVTRSRLGAPRRSPLRNQQRLVGGVTDHRLPGQPVGQVGDRLLGEQRVSVEGVMVLDWPRRERLVEACTFQVDQGAHRQPPLSCR
jgi:hypothetical protein